MTTATQPIDSEVDAGGFEHLGLLYRDPRQYLAATAGFVHSALAADQPVLVAVPGRNLDLIRDGLGGDANAVQFADMSVAGRNPGSIIPGVLLAFADRYAGRRVSIIGEPIWPARNKTEYPACATHEALINAAFAGRDAAILCPYDVAGLSDESIVDAHRTHPVMVDESGNRWASGYYTDPLRTAAMFNQPLSPLPPTAARMTYQHSGQLVDARKFVTAVAVESGLDADRVGPLAVAVNELMTNTLEHTDGPGTVSVWAEPDALLCQVDDTGHLTDPLAGRVTPPPQQLGGRGLLLVNQLCDLVRIFSEPGHTSIRLHTYL